MKALRIMMLCCLPAVTACNRYEVWPEQSEGFIKFFTSNLSEHGLDVKAAADGGYVAIGEIRHEDGTRDIYLVKTDRYGNAAAWSPALIGTEQDDVGNSLQVVPDGYVILGASRMHPDSSYDMYLVKTDLQGNKLWESWTGGGSTEIGNDLLTRPDGGFIAAGTTSSYGQGIVNAYLVQFDGSGNMVYQDAEGFSGKTLSSVRLAEGEHFYFIAGVVAEESLRMYTFGVDKDVPNISTFNTPQALSNTGFYRAIALPGGDFLVCGLRGAVTNLELYLARLRPGSTDWQTTFSMVWEKTFAETGDVADFIGYDVCLIDDNTYALIGSRTETGNEDMLLLRVDGSGSEIGRSLYGDEGFQRGRSLEIVPGDGGLIIVGSNGAEDQSMISLMKTDAGGKF